MQLLDESSSTFRNTVCIENKVNEFYNLETNLKLANNETLFLTIVNCYSEIKRLGILP